MVGSSILPVCIHKNKLLFLFGKECSNDDTPGWSDFGGGIEHGENPIQTALREGGEELTGFLGDGADIKRHIQSHGGYYHINHKNQYHVHVISVVYDENLPKYYNHNHEFLWERMDKQLLKKTKLFEKINIKWFTIEELKSCKHEFRTFYQEIVDNILSEIPDIRHFLMKSAKKHKKRKTRKTRSTQKKRT